MRLNLERILDIGKIKKNFKNFSSKKILLIGDIILDHYIFGDVKRISPEAPVPVVEVKNEMFSLGGAGNTSVNIKDMGGDIFLISSTGKDENSKILENLLSDKKIEFFLLERDVPTIVKTRIIAKNQQIVRIDREKIEELSKKEEEEIKKIILKKIDQIEIIVVSDYGKGLITKNIIEFLKKFKKRIIVDPKPEHFKFYKDIFCITPNKNEAILGIGKINVKDFKGIIETGIEILNFLKSKNLIITLGKDGMIVFKNKSEIYHIPSIAKEVYDVTGAGDTICAIFSLYLCVSNDVLESAIVSNFAAGIVVGKIGTATTNQKEFINFFKNNYKNFFVEKIK
ncbi:MAG: PfkB family carbohydrate kinase [Candidatus Omnitrophica bacterium]|nr:PfkB family carbohydrate kinase [Candidatus Omnitrophota bacterium]MCM8802217.1 PfkB family carbohydrate kinase [Candidatus Omnitrophota bacterium]